MINTELVDKLNHLQRDYESLQQQHADLEAAKAAQEQEFNRIHEEDLLKLDSLQGELSEKVTTLSAEKDNLFAVKEDTVQQLLLLQTESSQRTADFDSLEKDLKNVIEQKDHELEELRSRYKEMEEKYQVRWSVVRVITCTTHNCVLLNPCNLNPSHIHICIRNFMSQ